MGFILIGIVGAAIMFWLAVILPIGRTGVSCMVTLLIIFLLGGFILGLVVPVSGFHETELTSTTKLVSLSDQTISSGSGLIYVSISGENSYTYYVEVENQYGSDTSKAYKSKTISGSNITIIEEENYTDATLRVYETKAKRSFWTFALDSTKTEYVFFVPKGTIARNVSLG